MRQIFINYIVVHFKNSILKKETWHERKLLIKYIFIILIALFNVHCHRISDFEAIVYSSSPDGDRLNKKSGLFIDNKVNKKSSLPTIKIEDETHFQRIDGFGATFNEAGMIGLNSLDAEKQDSVLKMLFDPEYGAGFTLMKSPIAACDFASAGPYYSYNEVSNDTTMEHFSIDRDLKPNGLITYIKKASQHGSFKIQSTMDFAPDWMYYGMQKKEDKFIEPKYYDALALYYLKYIEAYASHGIPIDYLSLFNESACDTFPTHGYSSVTYEEMGKIIKDHLIPLLKAKGLSTKIMLGETCFRHNGIQQFPVVLDNPEVKEYIDVLAVHGYDWGNYCSLSDLHNYYPDYPIWMTEICYTKPPVFDFSDGEFWGNIIVNDLKNWVSGWIYWNMILDQEGGPWLVSYPIHNCWENNRQHPVVIINRDTKEVTYTGLYYYLAHFSKFIRPGAYRINCTGGTPLLNYVGFLNTDGTIIFNVINNGDEIDCKILWNDKMMIQKLKAHSITTIKWNNSFLNNKK